MTSTIKKAKHAWLVTILLLSALFSNGQLSMSGSNCVVDGGTTGYQYTISGAYQSSYTISWTISGGVVAGTSNTTKSGTIASIGPSLRVVWNANATGASVQVTVQVLGSNTKNVTVITIPNTVTPSSQNINYNSSATVTGGTPGSGCSPTYSFWWETSSSSSGPFTTVSGATSQNLTVNPVTQTAYYRRVLYHNGDYIYSAVVSITVPPLTAGSISTGSTNLTYNTQPSISQSAASGGLCSSHTYEWQQSVEGGPWQAVGTGAAYPGGAPAIIGTTKVRRKVVCGPQILYSNELVFTVSYTSAGAEPSMNFIRVNDIWIKGVNSWVQADQLTIGQKQQATQYFDGLGRPIETVGKQASPLGKDMVTATVYDNFSREVNKYLPYVSTATDGKYKSSPLTEQNSFNSAMFSGEQYYYSQVSFEASPLGRPLANYAPGLNWVGASRGVSNEYRVNTLSDSVRIWTISMTAGSIPTSSSTYEAGVLLKTVTNDEHGKQTIEFKDKLGNVILKKVQLAASPGTAYQGWLCTYYIYDDLKRLRFVIQPRAVELINSGWTITTGIANELCFRYEYDHQGNMIIKKVPGAGEVMMVYDARGRLVMTQDAIQQQAGKWLVTEYDSQNRPWRTGLFTDANLRGYHQNLAYASSSYPNTSSNYEMLTQNFYDDYSWVSGTGTSLGTSLDQTNTSNSNYFITTHNTSPTFAQPITQNVQTMGTATGSLVKVLGTSAQYLYTVSFYDDNMRVIQSQTINYTGGKDIETNQFDFMGKWLRNLFQHTKSGTNAQSHIVSSKMSYDLGGRITTVHKNIDNAASDQLIVTNTYNELGQLQNKADGNSIETLAYDYNIRGWMTSINKSYLNGGSSNYFGMELAYDKTSSTVSTASYAAAQYNGNITGTIWKTKGDGVNRKYDFTYDNVNRITGANFTQNSSGSTWTNSFIDFSVSNLTYDANGNILSMNQKGFKVTGSATIDQLTYSYQSNSNKLSQVNDAQNDPQSKLGDFKYTGSKQSTDYSYDGNGNLNLDNNKAISSITYNHLNLPAVITVTSKGTITYTYDAAGTKIKKVTVDNTVSPSLTTTTLYLNAAVYQNDTLQFIGHEEGRVRWAKHKYLNGTTGYEFEYDYFLKDHLGNVRMVLTQQKDTAQYMATMESAYRSTESQLFYNIPASNYSRASVAGYPTDATTSPNDSLMRLNGSGQKVGAAIILKVMSGDVVDIAVKAFYKDQTYSAPNSSVNDILSSLANGAYSLTGGTKGTLSELNNTSTSPLYAALTSFISNSNPTISNKPRAHLNWILLDEQFQYVNAYPQSGALAVGNYASNSLNTLAYTGISITKNGYLYIYVNNETPGWDVFFDNMSVKHYTGPLMEEMHYYPFGLAQSSISSKAAGSLINKYKFNSGSELQSGEFNDGSGLELYDAVNRMYDSQLGRFFQVDELAESAWEWSIYAFGYNAPINFNDPLGLEAEDFQRKRRYDLRDDGNTQEVLETVVVKAGHSRQALINTYWIYRNSGRDFREAPKDIQGWMNNYHQVMLHMERVNQMTRESDEVVLEIGSWFIPSSFLLKVKYLRYAGKLFKLKRGRKALEKAEEVVEETVEHLDDVVKGKKLYSDAMYKKYKELLIKEGKNKLLKAQKNLQKRLDEHIKKLAEIKENGGFSSSVEREIKNFEAELQAIEELLNL